MSTPDQPEPVETSTPPEIPGPQDWSETDLDALVASDVWLHTKAPPELIARYRGMHVAVVGEQIIDGDADFDALGKRLEARGEVPWLRVLFRYIPSDEESLRLRY
jgi:hypothetical protein